jgi:hypothetical protein
MDGMNGNQRAEISGPTTTSHFFILPFDFSSPEQVKIREEWSLIVQEAKAHPEP